MKGIDSGTGTSPDFAFLEAGAIGLDTVQRDGSRPAGQNLDLGQHTWPGMAEGPVWTVRGLENASEPGG